MERVARISSARSTQRSLVGLPRASAIRLPRLPARRRAAAPSSSASTAGGHLIEADRSPAAARGSTTTLEVRSGSGVDPASTGRERRIRRAAEDGRASRWSPSSSLFWVSLAALVWTHVRLSARAVGARARLATGRSRGRRAADGDHVVAAHNEETVIVRRIENLRALDYPTDRSRSSSPPTLRRTQRRSSPPRGRARRSGNPRGGKVAAQNHAVREPRASRRVHRRQLDVGARCAAAARARLRRPRRRLRVRPTERPGRRRAQ